MDTVRNRIASQVEEQRRLLSEAPQATEEAIGFERELGFEKWRDEETRTPDLQGPPGLSNQLEWIAGERMAGTRAEPT